MRSILARGGSSIALGAIMVLTSCSDPETPLAPAPIQTAKPSAFLVSAVGTYIDVAATNSETCAVRNDGVVRCFAQGRVQFEKTAAIGAFTAVATWVSHFCALRSDGIVECWGDNTYGQAPPVVTPPTGTTFIDVDLGAQHSCSTRSDGVIQCWGDNSVGQAPPTRQATAGTFTAVVADGGYTCGLTSFGVMECFGGLTGIPNGIITASTGSFTKLAGALCGIRTGGVVECVNHTPIAGTFVDYEFNGETECGITVAGLALCAGPNRDGEAPPSVTPSTGTFTRIALGVQHSCALRSDGGIDCWGYLPFGAIETIWPVATFTAPASVIVGQPIALALTNANVPGYPQATSFTYTFDCGSGTFSPLVPGTVSTASCQTSSTGTRVVRGRVRDQNSAETTYSATVSVKDALQGATDLATEVQLAPLSPDIRKALMAKLDAAVSAIAKGKTSSACSALADFINQVNAQKGKAIPTATANAWIQTAQQLRAAIGC
jgi:hypothetical protein